MIGNILSDRVRDFSPANAIEQEHVLLELLQQYILATLSRARFFSKAMFHGGTCLRILYGMSRFSEDLDFLLKQPVEDFCWTGYLERIQADLADEGIRIELQDKSKPGVAVQKAFIKTSAIGEMPIPELPFPRRTGKKLKIKLEIDSNPPAGSIPETRYLGFPVTAAITTQTLESSFATKSHALLCREYIKGRDWYDFLWYVGKQITPQLALLGNALDQQGPWAGQKVRVTTAWYIAAMQRRIAKIDWRVAREDIARFVPARELDSIALWSSDLFNYHLDKLEPKMSGSAG